MPDFRIERDSMGEMQVPSDAYYAAQTARAVENFPISKLRFGRPFIRALALIKLAAAKANAELGLLPDEKAKAILAAAQEVVDGKFDEQFVVDVFQTGSGSSTNMNMNEVIATRAIEILGGNRGDKSVHPNDDVNMGQSTNDVFPTAIHVAALEAVERQLLPALALLAEAFEAKATEFADVVKSGRTHLMDAVPVTLGQEFGGYAAQVRLGIRRVQNALPQVAQIPLGGTATGTGLNTHPEFAQRVRALLSEQTGLEISAPADPFEAQANRDALVELSAALKVVAVSMTKIANDIALMGSGPRAGLAELRLPELQKGSSIMPGKVNPVICEVVLQVGNQVMGNDIATTIAGSQGQFELNVRVPLIAANVLDSIKLLASAVRLLDEKVVRGVEADRERIEQHG